MYECLCVCERERTQALRASQTFVLCEHTLWALLSKNRCRSCLPFSLWRQMTLKKNMQPCFDWQAKDFIYKTYTDANVSLTLTDFLIVHFIANSLGWVIVGNNKKKKKTPSISTIQAFKFWFWHCDVNPNNQNNTVWADLIWSGGLLTLWYCLRPF